MKKTVLRRMVSVILPVLLFCAAGCEALSREEQTTAPQSVSIPEFRYTGSGERTEFSLAYYPGAPLNPLTGQNRVNLDTASLCYDGLFRLSSDFSAVPSLCESYETDQKTYTIKIRSNVLFHSGEALTSRDVVYSLKEAKKTVRYAERLKNMSSVTALDELTLKIVLSSADGALPEKLDIPVIREGQIDADIPDGTGSYMMSATPEGASCLVPHEAADGTVPFSHIALTEIAGTEDLILSVESGDVSVIRTNPFTPAPITFFGIFETASAPTTNLHFLGVNTGRAPLSDKRVRQALSLLIDRASLSSQVFSDLADPASVPCHPTSKHYPAAAMSQAESREAALALLSDAGISDKDGDRRLEIVSGRRRGPFSLTLLVNGDNAAKAGAAKAVAQSLDAAGITVTVSSVHFDEMTPYLKYANFDLFYGECALTPDFDVAGFLAASGDLNYSRYKNAELLSLYTAAAAASGDARGEALRSFYERFSEESPFIPLLFSRSKIYLSPGRILNFTPAPDNIFSNISDWNVR